MCMTVILLIEAIRLDCISATASDVKDMMDTIDPETAHCEFSAMDGVEGNVLIVLISRQRKKILVGKLKRGVQLIDRKILFQVL